MENIKPGGVYTTEETRTFFKISASTIKRMLKNNLIRANKVGGQYRILGKEILRIISPEVEIGAKKTYQKIKRKVKRKVKNW